MSLYPITLSIAQQSRGAQTDSETQKLAPEIRQQVLRRDDHTCQFCNFKSQKYQDVHFIDRDVSNLQMSNMVTACIFCHQCFDLEKVAEMGSGVLVWLPEIEQTDLHHMARALFVARISQGSMADTAKKTMELLMERREEVKTRIQTDDPQVLAMVMRDFLGDKQYALRDKKLDGIRLLPLDRRKIKEGELEFNQFPQILAYWRSKDGPFGKKVPNQWKNFYAQIMHDKEHAA